MKKIFKIAISLVSAAALFGCDDYLDRDSLTVFDDNNYWSSENNVRLFVNGAYGTYFNGYSDNWGQVYAPGVYSSGEYSDDRTTTGTQANILLSVPADNWYRAELGYRGYWLARRGSNPWNYGYIRKWNLLIARLEDMKSSNILDDEAYAHWMGVARVLRGFEYSRFVESFGDIPYYDHEITDMESDEEYGARTPRTEVMDHVLDDFQYAMDNVRTDDGTDYINRDVVATVASRCLLFEGTWYIYHKNDAALQTCSNTDSYAQKFLQKAMEFAQVTIDSGKYSFDTDFRTLFGSLYTTLTGTAGEVILYRTYNKDVYSSIQHCIASYSNGSESQTCSGNLSTLKAWICQDGQPYSSSTVENVQSWRLQDMVVTRDPRFEATFWDEPKNSATGLYCEKFIDREGVTYSYNGETLPTQYGSCTNENGFPCIRYAETVLNWLEAKAELADKFGGTAVTQSDIDKSINAIRSRPLDDTAIGKGVKQTAALELANLPDDPERTGSAQQATLGYKTTGAVSPLLWEIRRERRMEFFLEQVRVRDIRRWGQLELMTAANNPDMKYGGYVELDLAATLTEEQAAENGFPNGAQTTNLKKTLNDVGYHLLTSSNSGVVGVIPIEGYNADGTLKLGEETMFDFEAKNHEKMRGFLIPRNFVDRDERNIDVRNYLEPICTDILNQYQEAGYGDVLYQNAGWE